MKITSSHRQLSENDLRLAEQEMGVELPPDLRAFYLERNGGTPERRLFVQGEGGFLVQAFEPLVRENEPKNNNVVKSFKTWRAVGDRDVLKLFTTLLFFGSFSRTSGSNACTRNPPSPCTNKRLSGVPPFRSR